jgi:hypothetical protein
MNSLSSSLRNNLAGIGEINKIYQRVNIKGDYTDLFQITKLNGTNLLTMNASTSTFTVNGNMVVTGTTEYIASTNTYFHDNMLAVAYDNTTTDTIDTGIFGVYNSGGIKYSGLFRDHTDGVFKLFSGLAVEPSTTINPAYTLAPLQLGALTATTGLFSGNLTASANILLPVSNSARSAGVISINSQPFMSGYDQPLTTSNVWLGKNCAANAANFTSAAVANVSIGNLAMGGALTSGATNVAVGQASLSALTSGSNNVGLGYAALNILSTGSLNTGVGYLSLLTYIGSNATACGAESAKTMSTGNIAAFGKYALRACTGVGNSAFGINSGQSVTSGTNNTLIGDSSGASLLTGSTNTIIGYTAGSAYTGAETNNIMINAVGTVGESNTIRLGNSTHTATTLFGTVSIPGDLSVGGAAAPAIGTITLAGLNQATMRYQIAGTTRFETGYIGSIANPVLGSVAQFYFYDNVANAVAAGVRLGIRDSDGAVGVSFNLLVGGTIQMNGSSSGNVILSAGTTPTSYTLTLPPAVATQAGSLMVSSAAGVLSNTNTNAYIDSATGNMTLAGTLAVAGGSTISSFSEVAHSTAYTGIWAASQSITMNIQKFNNWVRLQFPRAIATANTAAAISLSVNIPATYRPAAFQNFLVLVSDNGTAKEGLLTVNTDGSVSITTSVTGASFAGSGSSGMQPTCVTYSIV